MSPETEQLFSIFIPLIFVVITELSAVVKDVNYVDQEDTDSKRVDRRPVFFPKNKSIPSFGRLNVIHGLNLSLLHGCFLLTVALLSGLLRSVLVILIGFVWLSLPLLETDVFGEILQQDKLPTSLYFHGITSLASMVYIGSVTATRNIQGFDLFRLKDASITGSDLTLLLTGIVLLLLAWFGFLLLLEYDLDRD